MANQEPVLAQFRDGSVYFSPSGLDLGGSGSSENANKSGGKIVGLFPVPNGVYAQFSNGSVYRSLDGRGLDGGGPASKSAYGGPSTIAWMQGLSKNLSPQDQIYFCLVTSPDFRTPLMTVYLHPGDPGVLRYDTAAGETIDVTGVKNGHGFVNQLTSIRVKQVEGTIVDVRLDKGGRPTSIRIEGGVQYRFLWENDKKGQIQVINNDGSIETVSSFSL